MSRSKISIILKALLVSYIVTGVCLLILAAMLFWMELDEKKVAIGIIVIYLVSCFLGGFLAGKKYQNRKFVWGIVTGVLYFVLLVIMSLLVKQGLQNPPVQLFTTFLLCMGGGMLGGMLS